MPSLPPLPGHGVRHSSTRGYGQASGCSYQSKGTAGPTGVSGPQVQRVDSFARWAGLPMPMTSARLLAFASASLAVPRAGDAPGERRRSRHVVTAVKGCAHWAVSGEQQQRDLALSTQPRASTFPPDVQTDVSGCAPCRSAASLSRSGVKTRHVSRWVSLQTSEGTKYQTGNWTVLCYGFVEFHPINCCLLGNYFGLKSSCNKSELARIGTCTQRYSHRKRPPLFFSGS